MQKDNVKKETRKIHLFSLLFMTVGILLFGWGFIPLTESKDIWLVAKTSLGTGLFVIGLASFFEIPIRKKTKA